LSQNRLARGIDQDPAVIARMCHGKALTGPQSRERVLQIIGWLHAQGVLDAQDEANALLAAADKPGLMLQWPREAQLLQALRPLPGAAAGASPVPAGPGPASRTTGLTPWPPVPTLPVPPTALIGREDELAQVCALLWRGDVRLVTITGPPGIGKTRLALQVAAELLDDFADNVFFVPLAAIRDPLLVPSALAAALGVQEMGSRPIEVRLAHYFRDQPALLVLDNFEQVLPAAPLLGRLLTAAPRLLILVTSRAVLHVYGEHEFALPPLAWPDPQRLPGIGRLEDYEAMRLFCARAQAVKSGFMLTAENAELIATICARLEGLPLALELAAARLKLLPLPVVLERLGSRLDLLTGGARDLPVRHQTLRSAIAWSYDLLRAAEQQLFRRLGVFVDSFSAEAAEAVCDPRGTLGPPVWDGLASLVDQSLLRQEEQGGAPRFRMLETLREYALERLTESGELESLQQAHAQYYLMWAETAERELAGAQQATWLARIETEYSNLRTALATWLAQPDGAAAGRLASTLGLFWETRGYLREGRRWLADVLGEAGVPSLVRAKVLTTAALLAWVQGDYAQAQSHYAESLALYRAAGDQAGMARALQGLGILARIAGDYAEAGRLYQEGLALYEQMGAQHGVAALLNNLGNIAYYQGDYVQARARQEASLALYQQLGDQRGIATLLTNLGNTLYFQGAYERARACYQESLTLNRQLEYKLHIVGSVEGLAKVAGRTGQAQRAATLFGIAAGLREASPAPLDPADRAITEQQIAHTRRQLAAETFAEAWATGQAMGLAQALSFASQEAPGGTAPNGGGLPRHSNCEL
jgi:non-specific serine/threonine protein kinase